MQENQALFGEKYIFLSYVKVCLVLFFPASVHTGLSSESSLISSLTFSSVSPCLLFCWMRVRHRAVRAVLTLPADGCRVLHVPCHPVMEDSLRIPVFRQGPHRDLYRALPRRGPPPMRFVPSWLFPACCRASFSFSW